MVKIAKNLPNTKSNRRGKHRKTGNVVNILQLNSALTLSSSQCKTQAPFLDLISKSSVRDIDILTESGVCLIYLG